MIEIINKIISDKYCVSLVAPEPTQYYCKTYYNFIATSKCGLGLYMQRIRLVNVRACSGGELDNAGSDSGGVT